MRLNSASAVYQVFLEAKACRQTKRGHPGGSAAQERMAGAGGPEMSDSSSLVTNGALKI